jgi:hypothetical protein
MGKNIDFLMIFSMMECSACGKRRFLDDSVEKLDSWMDGMVDGMDGMVDAMDGWFPGWIPGWMVRMARKCRFLGNSRFLEKVTIS